LGPEITGVTAVATASPMGSMFDRKADEESMTSQLETYSRFVGPAIMRWEAVEVA
jgi:hypothetical protein